jgi:thioredoxin:protein disulfide reductase
MLKKIIFFIFISFFFSSNSYSQQSDYVSLQSFKNKDSYSRSDTIYIVLNASIKENFHINSIETNDPSLISTSIEISSGDFNLNNLFFPDHKKYKFEFSENEVNVYEGEIFIGLTLFPGNEISDGDYDLDLNFYYQACDDKVCYPPKNISEKISITINSDIEGKSINSEIFSKVDFSNPTEIVTEEVSTLKENPRTETSPDEEDQVGKWIEERGLAGALALIFMVGLALNLTPCVYPLIPITVSYFGAQASGNKAQSILMGGFYALGMAVTYSALGVFAALTGGLLGSALQSPIVVILIALIFFTLGLSMFGLFEIRVPQKLAMMGNKNRSGLIGSLLMGLTVGFIAAPCIGPLVLSLLVHVAKIGSAVYGFFLFLVLSFGLGLPYVFLAASSSSISKLPRSGEWMEGVKIIFGLALFGMVVYTLEPLISKDIFIYLLPVYLILTGIYLILINKKGSSAKVFTSIKYSLSIVAIIWGTWMLKPDMHNEVEWKVLTSYEQIENSIKSEGKPVMIDFYADWCAQCKELDKYTYTDSEVIELSKDLNNIKIDLTQTNEEITTNFGIKGLPVVVFLDAEGNELKELRVTGFMKPADFKDILISLNKFTAQK